MTLDVPTPIIVDDTSIDAVRPETWEARLLYAGDSGSENWLAVVQESGYPLSTTDACHVRANRLAAIEGASPAGFVSLGPGDGLHDVELVRSLAARRRLSYVPVDLSRGLLELSIRNLREHIEIPLALQCEFECGMEFVRAMLDRHVPPGPVLYSLVGGTVGNLDLGLSHFLGAVRRVLRPGDSFLMDVPLAGHAWTPASEPRLSKTAYTPAFRRFVAGGLVRAGAAASEQAVVDEFDERIQLDATDDREVAGTRIVNVRDLSSGRVVLRFRRFRWQSLIDWLRGAGFAVAFERCSIASDRETFGMGVVLLQ